MSDPTPDIRQRRLREAGGVVLLALAVLWLAALVSYDPADPSLFAVSDRTRPANWVGHLGASLAEISIQLFGLGAFLVPIGCSLAGLRLFRSDRAEAWPTRLVGIALGVAGFCGLLALGPPGELVEIAYPFGGEHLVPRGGFLGGLLVRPLHAVMGGFGAAVALFALTGLAFLLATSLSLAELASKGRRRATDAALALIRRWTHARERQERETMKRDVVRKHLERAMAEEESEAAASGGFDLADPLPVRVVVSQGPRKPFFLKQLSGRPTPPAPRPPKSPAAPGVPALAPAPAARGAKVTWSEPAVRRAAMAPILPSSQEIATPAAAVPVVAAANPVPVAPIRMSALVSGGASAAPAAAPPPVAAPRVAAPAAEKPRIPSRPAPKQEVISEVVSTLSDYTFPPTSLLDRPPAEPTELDRRALYEIGTLIGQKCSEFRVEGQIEEIQPGPVVTTYEFKPSVGVKYNRIVNLSDDLALALKAESVRIERIPGRSTVGIEVPNPEAETIALRELLESERFVKSPSMLTIALGKDIHGGPMITDLARMPHLLIAGATGAGKSVGINTLITSILFKARPQDVKFIMIDPKMVELKPYEDLPHLACPIVTDPKKAANALKWAVAEMEDRYRTLAFCGVRNIDQYNGFLKDEAAVRQIAEKAGDGEPPKLDPMPFITIIIDELADLMMTAPKEVEEAIARLAQMARAVGIHLVVATQRPSVDVITGVIKANFPSRIAFKTSSKIDSRTILDGNGAEKLLGRGDMLFVPPGTARLTRIHGAYISEKETASLVRFLKKQGEPKYNEEILKDRGTENAKGFDDLGDESDPMYDEAARLVVTSGQASASFLQRKLKLGYARAARLVDMMERDGIVGPGQGAKPREILVPATYFEEVDEREG